MSIWSRLKRAPIAEADQFVSPETSTEEAGPQRYLPGTIVRCPVGGDSHLLYSLNTGSAQILPSYQAELLDHCFGLETLEEHARACSDAAGLSAVGGANQVATVVEELENLAGIGLLISESEVLETCRERAGQSPEPPPIATVGVVTANRIDMLERCLTSYMENCRAFDRTPKFAVMDDSSSAEIRGATRQLLVELKKRFGFDIAYAGLEEKRCFAKDLVTAGDLPPDVVNFALFAEGHAGFSGGKNRNALLLQTAGEMFLSTDDDAVCRLTRPLEEDLDYDESTSSEMEWWFFADRDAAINSGRLVTEDLLALHEMLVGKELCNCVVEHGTLKLVDFAGLDSAAARVALAGRGRVIATFTGIFGDSGAPIPAAFRQLGKVSRDRLLSSEDAYFAASVSREVLRVIRSFRIGRTTNFNTTGFAADNREGLPPFIPISRGEDYLFANLVRHCWEDAFFGDVPRAVLHAPPEHRAFSTEETHEKSSGVQLSGLIWSMISEKRFWPGMKPGAERLRSVGKQLREFASMPQPEFDELARVHLLKTQTSMISALESQLERSNDVPKYWRDDVHERLHRLRTAMTDPSFIVPLDVREGRDLQSAQQVSQQIVARFGELLDVWPDMIEAARKLRANGRGLANSI